MVHTWQNVLNANGLLIALTGMLLVFFSLALISYIISMTPFLLKVINRFYPEQEEPAPGNNKVKTVSELDVVAAIGTALCYSEQRINK